MRSSNICISTRPLTSLGKGHLINAFVIEYSFPLAVLKHTHPHEIQNGFFVENISSEQTASYKNQGDIRLKYRTCLIHLHDLKVIHVGCCILHTIKERNDFLL